MVGIMQSEEIETSSETAGYTANTENRKPMLTMPWIISALLLAISMGWCIWEYAITNPGSVEESTSLTHPFPDLVYSKDMHRPLPDIVLVSVVSPYLNETFHAIDKQLLIREETANIAMGSRSVLLVGSEEDNSYYAKIFDLSHNNDQPVHRITNQKAHSKRFKCTMRITSKHGEVDLDGNTFVCVSPIALFFIDEKAVVQTSPTASFDSRLNIGSIMDVTSTSKFVYFVDDLTTGVWAYSFEHDLLEVVNATHYDPKLLVADYLREGMIFMYAAGKNNSPLYTLVDMRCQKYFCYPAKLAESRAGPLEVTTIFMVPQFRYYGSYSRSTSQLILFREGLDNGKLQSHIYTNFNLIPGEYFQKYFCSPVNANYFDIPVVVGTRLKRVFRVRLTVPAPPSVSTPDAEQISISSPSINSKGRVRLHWPLILMLTLFISMVLISCKCPNSI